MSKKIYFLLTLAIMLVLTGASCIKFSSQSQGVMGMYRSDNKGDSWKPINVFPTVQGVKDLSSLKVYKVFKDPSDPNAMYLGTRGQGLYYSLDNGNSWQVVGAMKNRYIYALAVDPKDKCNIYASDGSHIFQSTDCTRTWKLIFTEERLSERFIDLAVDQQDSKIIYGAQLNGDILRSSDSGKSWRIIKRFGIGIRALQADPQKSKRLYIASYKHGLFRSDDGGENWIDTSKDFGNFNDSKSFNRLILNPAQKDSLFWVSKYGILRSDDAGKTWKELTLLTPPGSVNIYSFAVSAKNQSEIYYTGTIMDSKKQNVKSTFYKSVDGGKSWVTKKLPTNTIPVMMSVHLTDSNMLFLGFTTLDNNTNIN